jgi:hypothetical protein
VARNVLLGIALLASLSLGGCTPGADEAAAADAQLAEMRARNDSLRAARTARLADSAARSTLAATTPGADSLTPDAAADAAAVDSARKAREIEIMRETFAYTGGTRDPFSSLIDVATSGPEIGDLELVGVYQDLRTPSNSVVVLREKVSTKRHKLRVGDQVGRARLVQIRPRDAVFTIQDFGYERQETLSLRKQEVETP